jgi:hypothetical protein
MSSTVAQTQARRQRNREWVDSLKQKCLICGSTVDLHFHHRDPSTKFKKVADMMTYSRQRIQAEIDKCDVLCEYCHKTLHSVEKLY